MRVGRFGTLFLLVSALALCGIAAYRLRQETQPELPALAIANSKLDLGEVWEQKAFAWDVPIENAGDTAIEIVDFFPSCSCASITPSKLTIPPGDTALVNLVLDLTDATKSEPIWDFEYRLLPILKNQVGIGGGWVLKARVRSVLRITPGAIDFGDSLVRGQRFAPKTVEITAHTPLSAINLQYDPRLAGVTVGKCPKDESKFELSITPRETLSLGQFRFAVELIPDSKERVHLPGRIVEVTGSVLDDVQALPSTIHFGARTINGSDQAIITLRSVSGAQTS